MTDLSFLDHLNPSQRQACEQLDGPVLILAGAGSGKTRTLIHRTAALIATGRARPQEILCVTFTNKAAGELRDRLAGLLGREQAEGVWAMTFHALCVPIIKTCAEELGYPANFSILDTDDCEQIIKQCLESRQGSDEEDGMVDRRFVRQVFSVISNAKNRLQDRETLADSFDPIGQEAYRVWPIYQQQLKHMGAVDFDDLLLLAGQALQTEKGRKLWARRFKYVMVDEYQDTNPAQYALLKRICAEHDNLCVVGDDDQSIYGWRGAEVEHILRFEEDWPGCRVVTLEYNYRSSPQIIEVANALIANNRRRHHKQLRATQRPGEAVELISVDDQYAEAELVAQRVAQWLDQGESPQEIAVMYRNNYQSRVLEMKLREHGIKYRVIGSVEFYRRAEVQTARAYLQLLYNPRDHAAFGRAISEPPRGVGAVALEKLSTYAQQMGWPIIQAAMRAEEVPELKPRARQGLTSFVQAIAQAASAHKDGKLTQLMAELYRASGFEQHLKAQDRHKRENRWSNVEEFIRDAAAYDHLPASKAVPRFLEHVALQLRRDEDEGNGVSLMTLHAAKGLEFDCVCLTGLEDALFLKSLGDPARDELPSSIEEEERRLLYVGITRAKRHLQLSYARQRSQYGKQADDPAEAGEEAALRFLHELPDTVRRRRLTLHRHANRGKAPGARRARTTPAANPRRWPTYEAPDGKPPTVRLKERPSPSPPKRRVQPLPAAQRPRLQPGMEVRHHRFGEGVVLKADQERAEVRFADGKTRTLMLAFAPLEVVS